MKIEDIKKDIEDHLAFLDAAEEEQHSHYEDYVESRRKAINKRDEAQKHGDSDGVAKAEREIAFWEDSMCDVPYEVSLLELERDAVEAYAKTSGLKIDWYGKVVIDKDANPKGDVPEEDNDDNDDERDEESMEALVANLFGDDKEATNHD